MLTPFRLVHLDAYAKRESRSMHVLGVVLFFVSLLMIPSLVISIVNGENSVMFIVPMIIGFVVSISLFISFKDPNTMRPADGLLMIFTLWGALFILGMLPYLIYGIGFVDSVFESVSGFTTAGATTLSDLAAMPMSLLLWRSMTQWIGGIIIVMVFMFVIPMVVTGGRSLLNNEMSGSGGGNLYLKMGLAAKQYILVYVVLTLIYFLVLLALGLSVFESCNIAMCVICTGGFAITNDSFAIYDTPVRIAVLFFMLISSTNFYLQYRAVVKREIKGFGKSEEFVFMCAWFATISVLISILMAINGSWTDDSELSSIVDVFFSVVSIGTTTGFTTLDYTTQWPFIGLSILLVVMIVGGSTGSTAGGVKLARAIILVKAMINEVKQSLHPNAVFSVKLDRKGVDDGLVHSATVVVVMFILTIFIGMLVFDSIMDMDEALFASAALVSGTGPGMGSLFGDYSTLPGWAKMFACALMILGRMEIVTVLVLFTAGFWKEVFGVRKFNKMVEDVKTAIPKAKDRLIERTSKDDDGEETVPEDADTSDAGSEEL